MSSPASPSDSPRFCMYCGHSILDPEVSNFCSNCGRPLGLAAQTHETGAQYGYPEGKKPVHFDTALTNSYWLWRRNQALTVPTMLVSSISVLAQSIFVIFGIILVASLENSGALPRIISLIKGSQYSALASLLASRAVLYPMVALLGSAAIITIIVSIFANGLSLSAEYVSYARALGGRAVGVGESIYAVKEKWKKMTWTSALTILVTYAPVGLALASLAYSLYFSRGSNPGAILGSFGFLFLGGLAWLLLTFLTMYSTISVAVDDISGFGAIRRSFRRTTSYFGVSLVYALLRVVSIVAIGAIGLLSQFIGLPLTSLASVIVTLIVVPVLHITKTTIYREIGLQEPMREFRPFGPEATIISDLFKGYYARYVLSTLRKGLGVLKGYVFAKRNLVYHISSALAFLVGVYAGSYIAVNGLASAIFALGYRSGQINPAILKAVPLSEGFDIFFHNWSVSLATALSGIWLVAPSLVTLGFNGVILGVVYYLTPSFTMFAAAIFPHGIIELPAFIIAGSVGMKLGVAFVRTLAPFKSPKTAGAEGGGGAEDQDEKEEEDEEEERIIQNFYNAAREAVYALIGLALLFFIAGFIEGNITPAIMRAAGWQ